MDLCILYLHHRDDALTRDHAARLRHHNPEAAFVPLTFRHGLPGAIQPCPSPYGPTLPREKHAQWRNIDLLVYAWARSPERVRAEHYIMVEYDTCCTSPLRDFYSAVWGADVAAASLIPWPCPQWEWFRKIKTPEIFHGHLLGLAPCCGVLLSRQALVDISELALQPIYQPLFSEIRAGTLARAAGFSPVLIRPDILQYLSSDPRQPDGRPGLWHTVKNLNKQT